MEDKVSSSITTSVKRKQTPSSSPIPEENYYGDVDNSSITTIESDIGSTGCIIDTYTDDTNSSINTIPDEELFCDNLECVDKCHCPEIDIVDDDYTDYEIINESRCIPIKNRYRKQTWYEYFRKLYMVSVILIISIVVYFYYSYSKRKDNITSKL